jgi:hypothetical protein
VAEAIRRVRSYGRQIERDLRAVHGLNIADWHRGTLDEYGALKLSSRLLIVLTDGPLGEDSWFHFAARGDYDRIKAEQEAKPMIEGRVKALKGLYAKVPQHLQPKEVTT